MKKLFKRKENGDIALISIFACMAILAIVALILEFGLIYFQAARLQNAVDSATVAVAHNLMDTDENIKHTVETYMKENGVDITKKGTGTITSGKLRTKITYGDNNAVVIIDRKGLLTEEAAANDDGTYITSGYLKVTVGVDCKEYWKTFDKMVVKSGYAKCDMQYNEMPEALKYTIFGNSTKQATDYRQMTVGINGRTNNTQAIANIFTNLINGINRNFVQKIIERLGGNPNYNELFNQHLSYATINGDVHSNSDISIGVNALQASRSKDIDYTGTNANCICQTLCKSESTKNTYCTVCQDDYRKCEGDEQTDDDYNQVHFTAVNNIDFSAGKIANNTIAGSFSQWLGTNSDNNTRVYVRNYQYIEQTQVALYVIDRLNFDSITSTQGLRDAFTSTAQEYMENSITLPDSQRAAVLAQAENLEYISKNKYQLNAQKSIVYAATNAMANQVMTEAQGGRTLTDFLGSVIESGYDPTATDETLRLYDGTNIDKENSVITFTKADSDRTAELYIVDAENTNRNVVQMNKLGYSNAQTEAAYRFAIAKTFRQRASYIQVPNMKPYFIRAINRSVKNSTTTKSSDSSDIETSDATSVKDAVKKSQSKLEKVINSKDTLATVENKDGTFTKGAADATTVLGEVPDGYADTYVDNSYNTSEVLINQKTSPLLKYKLTSTDSSGKSMDYNTYSLTKYKSSDLGHTKYNGVDIYDSNGNLNSAKNVVDDYNKKNGDKYGKNAVKSFEKSDVLVDSDYDDASVHDYEKHYGDDAVAKKKHYIENTLMLSDQSEFSDAAPAEDDVFFMSKDTKKTYFDSKISKIKEISKELSNQELSVPADLRIDPVESRYKTLIDATLADLGYDVEPSTGVSYAGSTASISKNYIKPDGTKVNESYLYEDLLPGNDGKVKKPVTEILEETRKDFAITPDDIQAKVDKTYDDNHVIKSTGDWRQDVRGDVGKNAQNSFPHGNDRINLEDKNIYKSIANAYSGWGLGVKRYGILVKSGYSVQVNGDFKLDEDDGLASTIIGDETDTDKQTYLYVKGNFDVGRCNVYIGDNVTVIVDGYVHVWNNHALEIGKNSKLIVGKEIEIQDGSFVIGDNSLVVAKSHIFYKDVDTATTAKVYTGGDFYKRTGSGDLNIGGTIYSVRALYFNGGSGNINFKENAKVFLGRDISTNDSGDINLGKNAIVVANRPSDWDYNKAQNTGVVRATDGHKITMDSGAVLVTLPNAPKDNASFNTYHRIDASEYVCQPGSTIVTDMIKAGNKDKTSNIANAICDKIDTNTLVFMNNAHVFATKEIYIANSKTVEMNPGTKLLLGNNASGESVLGNSTFKFSDSYNAAGNTNKIFAIGATGKINGLASGDYILYDGCYLSAPGLQIGNLTINQGGGFFVPKDESITVKDLVVNDGASTYIGTLNADNLTVNKDFSVNEIASAKQITVNSGKLLVAANCKVENLNNKSNVTVANKLTVTGKIENSGKILIGAAPTDSNPGQKGELNCSAVIDNTSVIQVYGNADITTLNNKYNTAKSAGSTVYVNDTFTAGTVNNEKSSAVICKGNLTADNVANTGNIQSNNITVNTSFTNNAEATVKVDNYLTLKNSANNYGFVEVNGNSQFETITNTADLKLNGTSEFTGTVTNTGKIQATSYGVTFNNVVNSGEISVAGTIASNGTVTNSNFICSNNDGKFANLVNGGVVSVSFLSSGTSSDIVNEASGVIEVFGGNNSAVSNITTLDNRGDFVSNKEIKVSGDMTNSGKFECFGTSRANNLTNTGKVYNHGSLIVTATINNNSNGNSGEDNSVIYVGDSASYILQAATINNYANIFADGGSLSVGTMFSCRENSTLYVNKGDITTNHIEIFENCSFMYNGNLTINGYLVNRTNLSLKGITAERIQNYGNLYVESSKNFTIRYFINMPGANFALDGGGALEVINHRDSISILNEGNMYVNGDVYGYGSIRTTDGEIYVYGDVDVANSLSYNSSAVYMEGPSQVYVYGDVVTNDSGNGITIAANSDANAKKAIYSVYGKGRGTIKSGSINCNQLGSRLYFGTDVEVTPSNNTQTVKGGMYIYGKYSCASEMNFYIQEAGLLYIKDDVDAPNTDVYVNDAGLYCYGKNVLFRNVVGNAAMVYFLGITSIAKSPVVNKVTISNGSLLYTPQYVTIPDSKLSVSADSTYLSDPSIIWPIGTKNFPKSNSSVITTGDVSIVTTLQIEQDQTLCVGGNIYLTGVGNIVVYGHLYVMGKIYYNGTELSDRYNSLTKSSFEELIDIAGSKADVFIGKTKSGVLKLKNYLNSYESQQIYIDNDLLINGNLSNSGKSKGGVSGNNLVPNRGESIITEGTSTVCISGNVYSNGYINNTGNAVYIGQGSSFSCGGAFYADSSLYNYGKFYVMGEFVNYKKTDGTEANNSRRWATERSDDKHYLGTSIKNGDSNNHTASIYIGGVDKKGNQSDNTIIFEGYVQNYGKINVMQPVYIKGHKVTCTLWMRTVGENNEAVYATRTENDSGAKYENAPRASIVAEEYSRANFGSNVAMLGGYVTFNKADSIGNADKCPIFSAEGDATYGMCIINGGIFYAKGNVGYTGDVGHTLDNSRLGGYDTYSDYYIHHLEIFFRNAFNLEGDKKGSYSIVNGYVFYGERNGNDCAMNTNALFYAGSGIQVGTKEDAGENDIGGTVQNFGSMYLDGALTVYSNSEYAISYIAVSGQKGSNTVIAGDCWSSGGTVIMRNSLFMCDGDFLSKRCSRIGVSEQVNSNDDLNSSSYLYVGGNMVTSTLGTGEAGYLAGNIGGKSDGNAIATWNYLDIFSNASVYVGGSFFTNSIFTPHKNVTLIVDGKDKGKVNTKTNFITWLQTIANNVTLSLNGYDPDDFKFIVNNRFDVQQTLREGRTKSMLNRFYVHGSAFLNGRAKISDMTKFYVYGDLVNKTDLIGKITAFEIGRAVKVSDDGDTWASKGTFIDEKDEPRFVRNAKGNLIQNPNYDYNYANACYVYVRGKLDLDRKVNIYPGTTVKTGKDYAPRGAVKLSHDSSVYSGGKISTRRYIDVGQYSKLFAKENIDAWNYICVREHGILYSGGDVKCGTSFEAKTASTIYSCGSVKATLSNIKIRDNSTVFCAGNMTALSYIELGKHDEKYKDTLRKETPESGDNVCTCTGKCTKDNPDGDCPVCKDDYTKCTAPAECICSDLCTADSITEDCPVCSSDWKKCEAQNPDNQETETCSCTIECTADAKNTDCPVCKKDYTKCGFKSDESVLENDITKDLTDDADGGEFYIGKKLASYTGYIRQYGFSSTVVGQYVFANKYLTLRSNADMWVLPEAYNNNTYKHVDKTFESDGTILGNIIKYIKETAYNIKDKLSFKNGSVYTMGDLTLNKNASLMGTYNMYAFGKATLLHDSLVYFGHDVKFYGPSLNLIDGIKNGSFTGFKAAGDVYTTLRCTNKEKHPTGYTIYTKNYDPNKSYKCDKCGASLSNSTVKQNVTCPVTIYANNEIVIATSTDMSMCYAVACNGDVTISDPYGTCNYDDRNIYQLPNAIASYNGNISYNTMYGKIAALFYAPNNNVHLDGYYQEIWGSIIGDTVSVDTFYINLHRFSNWRTMDLQIAESGSVYLISQDEYDKQVNNVDESYMHTGNTQDETDGGAALFFDRDVLNNGSTTGQGADAGN